MIIWLVDSIILIINWMQIRSVQREGTLLYNKHPSYEVDSSFLDAEYIFYDTLKIAESQVWFQNKP
jgi:hypothetical protein